MFGMRNREVSIVDGLNSPSLILLYIAALANPFCAQWRKALRHVAMKFRIAPWAARVVHEYRLIDFDFAVHGLSRCERDFPEGNANVGVNPSRNVNLLRIWKLAVTLAHKKIELGEQEKGISFPGFLIVFLTTKSRA